MDYALAARTSHAAADGRPSPRQFSCRTWAPQDGLDLFGLVDLGPDDAGDAPAKATGAEAAPVAVADVDGPPPAGLPAEAWLDLAATERPAAVAAAACRVDWSLALADALLQVCRKHLLELWREQCLTLPARMCVSRFQVPAELPPAQVASRVRLVDALAAAATAAPALVAQLTAPGPLAVLTIGTTIALDEVAAATHTGPACAIAAAADMAFCFAGRTPPQLRFHVVRTLLTLRRRGPPAAAEAVQLSSALYRYGYSNDSQVN